MPRTFWSLYPQRATAVAVLAYNSETLLSWPREQFFWARLVVQLQDQNKCVPSASFFKPVTYRFSLAFVSAFRFQDKTALFELEHRTKFEMYRLWYMPSVFSSSRNISEKAGINIMHVKRKITFVFWYCMRRFFVSSAVATTSLSLDPSRVSIDRIWLVNS